MKLLIGLGLALATTTATLAQQSHSNKMTHPALDISEPGQSAFAAIAEITSLLQNDPTTDWSRVNIEPLRQHLIDMDLVTVRAYVSTEQTEEGAVFTITGDERTLQAIRAMVPAHVPFLEKETGWKVQVTEIEHAVLLQVDGTATKIQALGFIGLMTIGAHHQEHHLAMAKGNGIH